jgi:poly(glycerol-phosphate) alpha-glucosyltransferase
VTPDFDGSVALVTGSLSRNAGGLFHSVRASARALQQRGVEVAAFGVRDQYTAPDLGAWGAVQTCVSKTVGPAAFGYCPELYDDLLRRDFDIVHQQGLWMLWSTSVSRWRRRTSRPVMITPRGMLDPWALRNSAWKKKLALAFYERRNLEGAACLHALTASEAASIRALGLSNPVALIPNGVDLPTPDASWPRPAVLGDDDRAVMLFLGRLHPKKGLRETLLAWARLKHRAPATAARWRLVLAGWDDGGQAAGLEALAADLGLADDVLFPGPLFGDEKAAMLAHAQAFILASYSEGLPMAVLEAWANWLPVFMTAACNLPEGFAAGAAVEITTDPDDIAEVLAAHLGSPTDLAIVGSRGRELVETRFTWDRVADDLLAVYGWLVRGTNMPACVATA